jgi:hypothetical protein
MSTIDTGKVYRSIFEFRPLSRIMLTAYFGPVGIPFKQRKNFLVGRSVWASYPCKKTKGLDYSSPLLNLPFIIYRKCSPIGIQEFFVEVHKIIRNLSALGYRTPALQKFIAIIEELIECLPSRYDREEYLRTLEQRRRDLLESARWPDHPSRKGYRGRLRG